MGEDEEQPQQQEACLKSKVPTRVLPPLLNKDLDGLLVEDPRVAAACEVLEKLKSGWVVAGREAQHASEYLDLVLLVGGLLLEVLFEIQ